MNFDEKESEFNDTIERLVFDLHYVQHMGWATPKNVVVTGQSRPYCADLNLAWKAAIKACERGFQLILNLDPGEPTEVEICTTSDLYREGHQGVYIQDDNPARAICRALIYTLTKRDREGVEITDE